MRSNLPSLIDLYEIVKIPASTINYLPTSNVNPDFNLFVIVGYAVNATKGSQSSRTTSSVTASLEWIRPYTSATYG